MLICDLAGEKGPLVGVGNRSKIAILWRAMKFLSKGVDLSTKNHSSYIYRSIKLIYILFESYVMA